MRSARIWSWGEGVARVTSGKMRIYTRIHVDMVRPYPATRDRHDITCNMMMTYSCSNGEDGQDDWEASASGHSVCSKNSRTPSLQHSPSREVWWKAPRCHIRRTRGGSGVRDDGDDNLHGLGWEGTGVRSQPEISLNFGRWDEFGMTPRKACRAGTSELDEVERNAAANPHWSQYRCL